MKDALELRIKGIKCDSKYCDYKNENVMFEEYDEWLNKPCPKCGANLLTQEDLDTTKLLIEFTSMFNKILPKAEDDEEEIVIKAEMNGTGNVSFKLDNGRPEQ